MAISKFRADASETEDETLGATLLQLAEDLSHAKLTIQTVQLGLQSERIARELSNPLSWVLKGGLEQMSAVESCLEALRAKAAD